MADEMSLSFIFWTMERTALACSFWHWFHVLLRLFVFCSLYLVNRIHFRRKSQSSFFLISHAIILRTNVLLSSWMKLIDSWISGFENNKKQFRCCCHCFAEFDYFFRQSAAFLFHPKIMNQYYQVFSRDKKI